MQTPILLKNGKVLEGETISHYSTDDAVRLIGHGSKLLNCTIEDTKPEVGAHEDMAQLYHSGEEPNSQFFGGVLEGNVVSGNMMTSLNGSQGIGAFDGGFRGIEITSNIIATPSDHEITLGGVLDGMIGENLNTHGKPVRVFLDSMRFGGGHPERFWVTSFADEIYRPIVSDGQSDIHDMRSVKWRNGMTYVDNFHLGLFRQLSKETKYDHDGFHEHFVMTLSKYEARTMHYQSHGMTIERGHIYIDNVYMLEHPDYDFWKSRWPNFSPEEFRSKDNDSLILSVHALDMLQRVRTDLERSIVPTSAYRTAKHNRAVGSRNPYSDHTFHRNKFDVSPNEYYDDNGGLATGFDIPVFSREDAMRVEQLAISYGFNAIGRYPHRNFIHIGMRKPKPSGRLYWWGRAW